jgi:uncharacterized membrane protein
MSNRTISAALAGAFVASLALAASAQAADEGAGKEKCYGISAAGQNDCASTGNNSCAGTSKADYDKGAWKYVPKGTCLKTEVTLKTGAKRNGSLEPVKG